MTKTDNFRSDWLITSKCEQVENNPNAPHWKDANHYKVVLYMGGKSGTRQYTTYYSMGYGLKNRPKTNEILECLAMDIRSYEDHDNFADWANNFGYSDDSIIANRIYKVIGKQTLDMKKFLYYDKAWEQFLTLEEGEDETAKD